MLHCFGAYDLYETDPDSPITQKYVDHLMSNHPNDLMNHCFFSDYDLITNVFFGCGRLLCRAYRAVCGCEEVGAGKESV